MSAAAGLEVIASVESEMSKRLGVKIQVVRSETTNEIAVTARYHAQKTVCVAEDLPKHTREFIDDLRDAAIAAKLALCSLVQEHLLNIDREGEASEIANAAFLYRTKLAELQNAQEHYSKLPDDDIALKTDARDRLIVLREQAENIRHKLLSLAAGNYPTGITL